ncbi:MAG: hypothetical protein J0H06_05280 [Actinobacteria bacterium]|nr:hypothetical protein [Actinomycetota bacterium]OJU84715.1 MAG: hypothetical protein BGO11_14585 [Solirubrobacterales bacterium 70-9]
MQALSDEQHIAAVEAKVDALAAAVDEGFAEMRVEFKAMREEFKAVRAEARSDFRTLVAVNLTMVVAMIFGFAGLTVAMFTHL